jgi:hypothetical protein
MFGQQSFFFTNFLHTFLGRAALAISISLMLELLWSPTSWVFTYTVDGWTHFNLSRAKLFFNGILLWGLLQVYLPAQKRRLFFIFFSFFIYFIVLEKLFFILFVYVLLSYLLIEKVRNRWISVFWAFGSYIVVVLGTVYLAKNSKWWEALGVFSVTMRGHILFYWWFSNIEKPQLILGLQRTLSYFFFPPFLIYGLPSYAQTPDLFVRAMEEPREKSTQIEGAFFILIALFLAFATNWLILTRLDSKLWSLAVESDSWLVVIGMLAPFYLLRALGILTATSFFIVGLSRWLGYSIPLGITNFFNSTSPLSFYRKSQQYLVRSFSLFFFFPFTKFFSKLGISAKVSVLLSFLVTLFFISFIGNYMILSTALHIPLVSVIYYFIFISLVFLPFFAIDLGELNFPERGGSAFRFIAILATFFVVALVTMVRDMLFLELSGYDKLRQIVAMFL